MPAGLLPGIPPLPAGEFPADPPDAPPPPALPLLPELPPLLPELPELLLLLLEELPPLAPEAPLLPELLLELLLDADGEGIDGVGTEGARVGLLAEGQPVNTSVSAAQLAATAAVRSAGERIFRDR